MRKLKLQLQISLDGFIAGTKHEMDWMTLPWSADVEDYVSGILRDVDCIILGRKLAEGFIPYWAGVAADPANPEQSSGKQFSDTPKIVFSKTLSKTKWDNTEVRSADLVKEIRRLKEQPGKDIYACGGANLVSGLISNNLIDEYFLFVNPVALGNGLSVFREIKQNLPLDLKGSQHFDCGIIVLQLQPHNTKQERI